MGVFNFFKKKKPPVKLSLEQIPGWLEAYLESVGVKKEFSLFKQELQTKIEKIGVLIERLQHAKLTNPQIPVKVKNIMKGHRSQYITRIESFVDKIELPEKHGDLHSFAVDFSEKVEILAKDSQKNFFVLKEFFETEAGAIAKKIGEIDKNISSLRSKLISIGVEDTKKVQEALHNYYNLLKKKKELNETLAALEKKKQVPKQRLKKVLGRLKELELSADFKQLGALEEKLDKAKANRKKIENNFRKVILGLERALKKYERQSTRSNIIKEYLKNPIKTLLEDKSLVIFSILKDMSKSLEKLSLKPKQMEKTKDICKSVTKKFLESERELIKKAIEEEQEVTLLVKRNTGRVMVSEQQRYKKMLEEEIAEYEKEIHILTGEIERISPRLLLQRVRDALHKLDADIVLEELKSD